MAQKVQILLVDDLDGSEASETVTFALDGTNYEIDLTAEHAEELRTIFAPYIEASRITQKRRGRKPANGAAVPAASAKNTKKRSGSRRLATVEDIEAAKA